MAARPDLSERRLRLFIAVEIPEAWREALLWATRELETAAPGFCRWVRPEGFHVTLAFLGNQAPATVPSVSEAMGHATRNATSFTLRPGTLGSFGSRAALQIVWAGIDDDPAGALSSLRQRVTSSLGGTDIAFDETPFRPHITLGRGRRGRPREESFAMSAAIEGGRPWATGEAKVAEIVLFKSDLRPTGSIYTAIERASLSG